MNSGGQLWMVVTAAVKRQRPSFSSFRSRNSTTTTPLTLIEAVRRLESQELSCESLLNACYERAIEGQKRWNAYTYLCPYEDLLSQAKASDQRRRAKGAVGSSSCPLDGIPVSIKSNIAVCGLPLTAASQMLTNTVSQYDSTHRDATTNISPYDAHVTIKLLREAGAILIGLTNMDEFGMGSWGISSPVYGPTYNPQSNDVLLSAGGCTWSTMAIFFCFSFYFNIRLI
jgi:aspartyl-tRNA(Asn)/glutamyl-tRNA(Gln) amidotransferase subunit A